MNGSSLKALIITTLFLSCSAMARAAVKPHSLFSDGTVLQQGVDVPIWGSATDGEKVTVKFESQTLSTTAKNGLWQVKLKPLKAGGPFTMTITGENTVTINNVL